MKSIKILATTIFMVVVVFGYSQNLSGIVISENGAPIVQATINIESDTTVLTNKDGAFVINDTLFALPVPIKISKEGFKTNNFLLNKNGQIFTLTPDISSEILNTVTLSTLYNKESGVLYPITKINENDINTLSPVTLVDVVNKTPGVYIQSGAINTNRITIRGVGSRTLFGTNKIRAYFNGIPITNGAGETAIDSYNTSATGSLEIIKGPKASQYGTNLGGTLLLATKKAAVDGLTMDNYFTVGSYGLFKHTTNLAIEDENLSVLYSYDHLQLNGYRDNNGYNRNSYLLAVEKKISDKISFGFLLQHFNTRAQIASSLSRENFEEDPTQAAFTWDQAQGFEDNRTILIGTNITTAISKTVNNSTSFYYSYLDKYEPRPFNILDEKINGYGVRSIFTKKISIINIPGTLSLGAEWNEDFYHWDTFENLYEINNNGSLEGAQLNANTENRFSINTFTTATLPVTKKFKTEIGLNINSTHYRYQETFPTDGPNLNNERNFDPIIAPNVTLKYVQNSYLQFFGNVSRGFNFPGIEETLTTEGTVNPDIGPEKGWNYELGSELSLFNNTLKITPIAYLLSITNLLVAERVGDDQFIGRNAGKTEHKGIELSINYTSKLSDKLALNAYMNSEFNAHKFIDFVDGDDNFSGNELTGVPDKKISAGMTLEHFSGLFAHGNYQYTGTQPITDANTLYSDAYNIVNVQAGYKREIYNFLRFEILGGINNIANEHYASSILINASSFGGNSPRYFYPGNPRNYYSSLRLSYIF